MPVSQVLSGGVKESWSGLSTIIGGVTLVGITEVSFDVDRKIENLYGAGSEPIAQGEGQVTYSNGQLMLYVEEVLQLQAAAPNGDMTLIPRFNIPIIGATSGLKYILRNCRITSFKFKSATGDTKILIPVPFIFAGIK